MNQQNVFKYKKIFITFTFSVIIYSKVVVPLIRFDDNKGKIIKIPTEFSGQYNISGTSFGTTLSFPIIPTFL